MAIVIQEGRFRTNISEGNWWIDKRIQCMYNECGAIFLTEKDDEHKYEPLVRAMMIKCPECLQINVILYKEV